MDYGKSFFPQNIGTMISSYPEVLLKTELNSPMYCI